MKIWETPGKNSGFIIPTMKDKLDVPLCMHFHPIRQRQPLKVILKPHPQFQRGLALGTDLITS